MINLYAAAIIAINLLIFSTILFIRKHVVLLMYLMGILGVFSFNYTKNAGSLRLKI
jgi:hypothetical protein